MKKLFLILSFGLLAMLVPRVAAAQLNAIFTLDSVDNRQAVVGLRAFSLLVSGFEPTFEFKVSKHLGVQLSAGYFLRGGSSNIVGGPYTGYRGEVQFRYYLLGSPEVKPLNGFYVAPYAQYKTMTKISFEWDPTFQFQEQVEVSASTASFGVNGGYQVITLSRISFDMFLGAGLYIPVGVGQPEEVHIPFVNNYNLGINIRGGFSIGLAF